MIESARRIAYLWHKNQKDKLGKPYIEHVKRVAFCVEGKGANQETIAAAWLHDIVEDTEISIVDIKTQFGSKIAEIVFAMTRTHDEDYEKYLLRLKNLPEALMIKTCDLLDNYGRLNELEASFPEDAYRLRIKYQNSAQILEVDL